MLKSGDHGDHRARWDAVQEWFPHAIDAGKDMRPRQPAHLAAHIGDSSVLIQRDSLLAARGAQGERDLIAGSRVRGGEFPQIHRGENVAVVDQQAAVLDPIPDVPEPAAGFEQDRFVEKGDVPPLAEALPFFRKVMGVDGEPPAPDCLAGLHGPHCQRLVEKRHQRLGQHVGERSQPSPQPRPEYESLRDHPLTVLSNPGTRRRVSPCRSRPRRRCPVSREPECICKARAA